MHHAPARMQTLRGEGPTARDAVEAIFRAFLGVVVDVSKGADDQTAVISAAGDTLESVILDLASAVLAARDDLNLALSGGALDGLIATDDGWRAWGTISGRATNGHATRRRFQPEGAAVEQTDNGRVAVSLTMMEEAIDG